MHNIWTAEQPYVNHISLGLCGGKTMICIEQEPSCLWLCSLTTFWAHTAEADPEAVWHGSDPGENGACMLKSRVWSKI